MSATSRTLPGCGEGVSSPQAVRPSSVCTRIVFASARQRGPTRRRSSIRLVDSGGPIVDAIEAAAARMEAIAAPLPENDGVRRFNELYLAVTRAVAAQSATAAFEDAAFVSRLDVVFADLYFQAIDDLAASRKPSRAWAPLFEARARAGIAPLQFAIAGMNAHINHDLVLALVTTTKELGCGLDRGTPQHRDYVAVDAILQRVQDEIKDRFTTGVVRDLDRAGGVVDDILANWKVTRARDNAWTQAQILDAIGHSGFLRKQFLTALARNVGFAGRALLIRLP